MKKVLCVILSLCCALFIFAGCSYDNDLSQHKKGYEFSAYPNCEFTYQLKSDTDDKIKINIKVSEIKVSIAKKTA